MNLRDDDWPSLVWADADSTDADGAGNDLSIADGTDARVAIGSVKWFDRNRGYGFVVPDDGGGDIMIHEKCLHPIGRAALQPGERLSLVFSRGGYGRFATSVREIVPAQTEEPPTDDSPLRPTDLAARHRGEGPLQPARVKWFDRERGFGFVTIFGQAADVFLHMQTVRRCGLPDIADGEAVAVRTAHGPRGLMVTDLRLWDSGSA